MNPTELLDSSIESDEDKIRKSYDHEDLKTFLAKSSIKDYFPRALQISDCNQLLTYLQATLSRYDWADFDLEEMLDLYILAIMMMTYEQDNFMVIDKRFTLLDTVSNLGSILYPDQIEFIANGLYQKFVQGVGAKRLENFLNMQAAFPRLMLSSGSGSDVGQALLLTILSRYTKVPARLQARNAFEMAKLVNWQQLANSDQYHDMFILMRSFFLVINMWINRYEFLESDLGAVMRTYFLTVCKVLCKKTDIESDFAMTLERFIALCVVRAARIQ
ncbi:GL13678 [Drosophila persimilis]|uniref:GL13678 n=1 Tax=Drosophila persimilis TaxID=7234 RepID=B4GP42_DROPE|nr:GL13678 [Drosophila persimilis]